MSQVTDFCKSASSLAAAMLGAETLSIGGGPNIDAVLAETSSGREFSGIGMDNQTTLSAVVRLADWVPSYPLVGTAYVGMRGRARGQLFRVGGVKIGAAFVTIMLEDVNEVQ